MADGIASNHGVNQWKVRCIHPDYPNQVYDFTSFAQGTCGPTHAKGAHNWKGGYTGRPGLLGDLMPVIKAKYATKSPKQFYNITGALRCFWRFLDGYEAYLQDKGNACDRIDRLHQVSGALLDLFSTPGPEGRWQPATDSRAKHARGLILDAAYALDLPLPLVSALPYKAGTPKDLPSEEEGLALIRHLRSEVATIFRRWQRADQLAKAGRNLIALVGERGESAMIGLGPTEADAHATYRALIVRTGHPLPTVQDFCRVIGRDDVKLPDWWPLLPSGMRSLDGRNYKHFAWLDCVGGLYPTSQDVCSCALLCLARSAWNPCTLLSLDINDWWNGYDDDHAWIYAPKERAGGLLQHSISRITQSTGFYKIVSRIIERTAALRQWISKHPDAVDSPGIALQTPWIGASSSRRDVFFVADPRKTATLNNRLTALTDDMNSKAGTATRVGRMTCSDFREIAAHVIYRESRYSMWMLAQLLGHSRMSTTATYVLSRASRRESHQLVATVMEDALGQMASTGIWDPTLTRAKVEGVEITTEAISRLNEYRKNKAYSGALCRDPCNPPRSIDPNHPQDGRTYCAQSHLCVARSCPQGIVTNDSLTDIAKTVAELEYRQTQLGMVRFSTGTGESDLARLRQTLAQWCTEEVEAHLNVWRGRIARGEHRPIWFGGQH